MNDIFRAHMSKILSHVRISLGGVKKIYNWLHTEGIVLYSYVNIHMWRESRFQRNLQRFNSVPEGYYVKWIQCHPKILPIVPPDACDKPKKIVVESKWIPFSPNLISKK